MIGRLVEDGIFIARLVYFYSKANTDSRKVGYMPANNEQSRKQRAQWAWSRALGAK